MDLLPPNATTQERAISLAVGRAFDMPIRKLWSPETCPEGILPWLAWALSVDEWDSAWPLDRKRSAVADSIETHRRKGTIGALRRALESLGYEVEIDEKTGEAYTFRLLFKVGAGAAGGALIDAAVTEATEIALRQKNARSELIGTQYLAENGAKGGPVIAGANVSGCETDVTEFIPSDGVIVTGDLVPDIVGFLVRTGTDENGRPTYATGPGEIPDSEAWATLAHDGFRWFLNSLPTGSTGPREAWRSEVTAAATPDLAAGWEEDPNSDFSVSGTPTFIIVSP